MMYVGIGLAAFPVVLFLMASAVMAYSMTRVLRWPCDFTPEHFGLPYQDVHFPSRGDGVMLSGWFIPAEPCRGVIVLLHGGKAVRSDPSVGMLDLVRQLHVRGYAALLFDFRGHGLSGGGWTSLGYYETRDALGAVDFLLAQGFPKERIGLLGFSMGATVALMVAAQETGLAGVVADSAYPDLLEIIRQETRRRTRYPLFMLWGMDLMSRLMYGIKLKAVRPEALVHKIPFPVLYILGGQDMIVSADQARRLLRASPRGPDQLWVVPEAGHVRAFRSASDGYVNRVVGYFNAMMGARRREHLQGTAAGEAALS